MAKLTYNIVAKNLTQTFLIGLYALLASKGRDIEVGPFDDDLMSRLYVWIKGDQKDIEIVLEKIKEKLTAMKIDHVITPYVPGRVKE